jgi:hypothetical protein
MKKILILLFVFTTLICKATTIDSVLSTTNTIMTELDTSTNLKMITTKTMEAIVYLAQGLKVSVNEVWNILVKQQQVKSFTYLLLLISSIFLDFLFIKLIKHFYEKFNQIDFGVGHILIIALCCATVFGYSYYNVQNLYPMLTGFINPQYGAIQDIVEIAKTLK